MGANDVLSASLLFLGLFAVWVSLVGAPSDGEAWAVAVFAIAGAMLIVVRGGGLPRVRVTHIAALVRPATILGAFSVLRAALSGERARRPGLVRVLWAAARGQTTGDSVASFSASPAVAVVLVEADGMLLHVMDEADPLNMPSENSGRIRTSS